MPLPFVGPGMTMPLEILIAFASGVRNREGQSPGTESLRSRRVQTPMFGCTPGKSWGIEILRRDETAGEPSACYEPAGFDGGMFNRLRKSISNAPKACSWRCSDIESAPNNRLAV